MLTSSSSNIGSQPVARGGVVMGSQQQPQ